MTNRAVTADAMAQMENMVHGSIPVPAPVEGV